eukprot:CAMPEP_0203640274 /NCGR_PEP_ID=MMETSP0088-20131115/5824_1 /ASSEMBLY_ACC=CAM_ASM_001087 /TAXON_ID=426623 /ORGANISM="Chaetoceros affinis, Strain CCMP159" /LENGTH=105 /DNA_ID=CAMNT_0050495415 /DNA_START=129 /DNA_END=446 /DNA_ORIENTATION=+
MVNAYGFGNRTLKASLRDMKKQREDAASISKDFTTVSARAGAGAGVGAEADVFQSTRDVQDVQNAMITVEDDPSSTSSASATSWLSSKFSCCLGSPEATMGGPVV